MWTSHWQQAANRPTDCVSWQGGVGLVELEPKLKGFQLMLLLNTDLYTQMRMHIHPHTTQTCASKTRHAAICCIFYWMNEGHMRGCDQYCCVISWTVSLLLPMYNSSMVTSSSSSPQSLHFTLLPMLLPYPPLSSTSLSFQTPLGLFYLPLISSHFFSFHFISFPVFS